ncbi:16S rRNA processing protein RimM [Aeromicrobium marinum DSM 15272]|uniref:Ribosome maturation factor RimM n=1 Tax=Aeromicrobium marinum DSM 15272 TaxID=585531 RepID=E2SD42_9ACTN|nr:ribosome maturation factor RimM [Aeromicrobium marinum]EFQ83145.1 16S rRNA processing protein RimM [Aeromicrobium marinum DSM 15272]
MLVVVGRVGRAHGIRGELNVDPRTDEPERRFAPGSSVVCGGRTLTVRTARSHGGRLVVAFAEITDRTAAEQFHGQVVEAEVDPDVLPDDDESYYDHQLVGLVVRQGGAEVGRVTGLLHLPAQDTLVLDVDGAEVLVPFVVELVPEVDLGAGHLVVADVPGLLDPDAADVAVDDGAAEDGAD